jgi:membrane dipeptidase
MNAVREERARRLHAESTIVLAHDHFLPPDDLEDLRAGGVTAKILMTVLDVRGWSPETEDYERSITELDGWADAARTTYRGVLAAIAANPELCLIRCAADVTEAKRQNRVGILLGAEGGKLIEDCLENLREFHAMGVRHILLTWAYNNRISAGELDESGAGLSEFGREVVAEMNRLGMVIDITHISRPAMREVLEISSRPVLNSHSTLKSISNRRPAMTESEIRALADRGGVFALHFMTHMLTGRFTPRATLEEFFRQLDAVVSIAGVDAVALGPDYLPYTEDFQRNTGQRELSFPEGLQSAAEMIQVTRGLVERGYDDQSIRKILGDNLLRLLHDTIG